MHVAIDEQLFRELVGSLPPAVGRRLNRGAVRVPDSLVCSEEDIRSTFDEVLRDEYQGIALSRGGREALLGDLLEDLGEDDRVAAAFGSFSRGRVREVTREFLAERAGVEQTSAAAGTAAA